MTTDHQTRIDELFEQTLELPENARRAFLERVCEGDVHLFAEVESLLDHDRRAPADFLMTPPMSGLRAANTDVEDDRLVGQQVGDFRVVRRIAVGGMGSVYEAEQQHPRRDGPLQPVWYRCLWPPERLEQVITSIWLQRPTGSDPDRRVGINFEIAQDYNRGGMVLLVNEHGHELPDSRQLGDNYNLNRGVLPPPEVFQLHDLPPTLEPMRPGAAGTPVRRSTETSQRAAESRVRP